MYIIYSFVFWYTSSEFYMDIHTNRLTLPLVFSFIYNFALEEPKPKPKPKPPL